LVCRGSSASFHDGRQHIRETSSARGALWSQPSAPASVLVVRLPGSRRCFLRPGSRSLEHPSGRPALRCGAALHDLGEQDRGHPVRPSSPPRNCVGDTPHYTGDCVVERGLDDVGQRWDWSCICCRRAASTISIRHLPSSWNCEHELEERDGRVNTQQRRKSGHRLTSPVGQERKVDCGGIQISLAPGPSTSGLKWLWERLGIQ
jgi:hypothetical protein